MNTRTYGYCAAELHQNFAFVFGCAAAKTVLAETSMVEQIVDTLANRFDRDTLTL